MAPIRPSFYIKGSVLPFEEDECHEFKGHRNVSIEDIPPWVYTECERGSQTTRKCLSRNLNAFLNSGRGGTVYCGVDDSGRVLGMHLTRFQRDHVLLSVRNTLQRYQPPVPYSRYTVRFVPVIERCDFGRVPNISVDCNSPLRRQPHRVATSEYCWCDADAKARSQSGLIPLEYVIEIEIRPWRATGRNVLSPFHLTEYGKCYLRFQASVRPISVLQCIQYTRQQVRQLTTNMSRQTNASVSQQTGGALSARSRAVCQCGTSVSNSAVLSTNYTVNECGSSTGDKYKTDTPDCDGVELPMVTINESGQLEGDVSLMVTSPAAVMCTVKETSRCSSDSAVELDSLLDNVSL